MATVRRGGAPKPELPGRTPPLADDWARVASLAEARFIALGITQKELQIRGGPSASWWRRLIRDYEPIGTPRLRTGLSRALGWSDDSVDRIVAGESPIEVEVVAPRQTLAEEVADLRAVQRDQTAAIRALADQLGSLEDQIHIELGEMRALLTRLLPPPPRRGGTRGR